MIRNVFSILNHVFFDFQSRFSRLPIRVFLFSNPFLSEKTGNPLPPCNGLVTCWRSLMLRWQEPEIPCHICHAFPVLVRSVLPVPFPCPVQHSMPLPSNRPPGCGKCCKRIACSCHRNSFDCQRVGRYRCKVARVFPNCLYSVKPFPLVY